MRIKDTQTMLLQNRAVVLFMIVKTGSFFYLKKQTNTSIKLPRYSALPQPQPRQWATSWPPWPCWRSTWRGRPSSTWTRAWSSSEKCPSVSLLFYTDYSKKLDTFFSFYKNDLAFWKSGLRYEIVTRMSKILRAIRLWRPECSTPMASIRPPRNMKLVAFM